MIIYTTPTRKNHGHSQPVSVLRARKQTWERHDEDRSTVSLTDVTEYVHRSLE
jgi:hypothetical protein